MSSNSEILQDLKMLTKALMNREGIQNYELHVKGFSEKGENFIGDVIFFTVVNQETNKRHNLVMKTAKRSDDLRKSIPVEFAYKRESFMYRELFPHMKKLASSTGHLVKMDYVARVYISFEEERRECIVLEDLRERGFRVKDPSKPMNLHHLSLVLKTLGKHHALSVAMRIKMPKVFEEKAKPLKSIWNLFTAVMDNVGVFQPPLLAVCKMLRQQGKVELAEKLEDNVLKNFTSILRSDTPEDDCVVICHGDCWNNNMMFKYEGSQNSHPSGVCFLDFQLSMFDSPGKDLSYFLYTTCDKSMLDKFDDLLHTYYDSFVSTLELLGCKPEEYFTYNDLMEHWRKYGSNGLILSTFALKMELQKADEVLDLAALLGNDSQAPETHTIKMENKNLFDNRIFDNFTHFAERFL